MADNEYTLAALIAFEQRFTKIGIKGNEATIGFARVQGAMPEILALNARVRELEAEVDRLRKERDSALGALNVKERERREHRDALQAWADLYAVERSANPTKREADLWEACIERFQMRVPLVPSDSGSKGEP